MNALILAGGFGTRLRPLTERIPKSLLPIGNRPFLEHQVRLLAAHGVHEAILLTGYLADDFVAFLPVASSLGVTLEVSTETSPLGTAGAVRSVLDRLDGETVVFNGDVLTDLDLTAMAEFHRVSGSILTIALTEVTDATPYGLVQHDASSGRIDAFLEKDPKLGKAGGWINAGTYILEPAALKDVPPETEWSFEYQVFPGLLEAGEPMFAYRSAAYWLDIGTRERYLQAHADLAHRRMRAPIDGRIVDSMTLQDGTVIEGPVVLAHAAVEPGALLGPETCLAAGVRVASGAVVQRSVLLDGAVIGANAVVSDSIVATHVEAGAIIDGEILA